MYDKEIFWYQMHKGERLPESQGQGITMAQTQLAPLASYAALISGKRYGLRLSDLRTSIEKLKRNEAIFCDTCCRQLSGPDTPNQFFASQLREREHAPDCKLLQECLEVLNTTENKMERNRITAECEKLEKKLARQRIKLDYIERSASGRL